MGEILGQLLAGDQVDPAVFKAVALQLSESRDVLLLRTINIRRGIRRGHLQPVLTARLPGSLGRVAGKREITQGGVHRRHASLVGWRPAGKGQPQVYQEEKPAGGQHGIEDTEGVSDD